MSFQPAPGDARRRRRRAGRGRARSARCCCSSCGSSRRAPVAEARRLRRPPASGRKRPLQPHGAAPRCAKPASAARMVGTRALQGGAHGYRRNASDQRAKAAGFPSTPAVSTRTGNASLPRRFWSRHAPARGPALRRITGRAPARPFLCPRGPRKAGTGSRKWHAHEDRSAMPKRTDISTILIIGAGPIVIGQACEFDYSGTQACKALKDEGYRIVLVNSNPATIMTDPDLADATYIEPITPEIVAKIIEKERNVVPGGFALLPTMGGQTALNCALSLRQHGRARQVRRRDDRRDRRGDRQGRGPRAVPRRDDEDRPRDAALDARQRLGAQAPGPRAATSRSARTSRGATSARREKAQALADFELEWKKQRAGAPRALSGSGADRGAAGARRRRPAGDHPPVLHARRHRRRHRLQQGASSSRSSSAASTPRRPTRC